MAVAGHVAPNSGRIFLCNFRFLPSFSVVGVGDGRREGAIWSLSHHDFSFLGGCDRSCGALFCQANDDLFTFQELQSVMAGGSCAKWQARWALRVIIGSWNMESGGLISVPFLSSPSFFSDYSTWSNFELLRSRNDPLLPSQLILLTRHNSHPLTRGPVVANQSLPGQANSQTSTQKKKKQKG